MKILSRAEELIMISILKLGTNAYCVPIMEEAKRITNEKWTLGGIYIPLGRLEKKGYLTSSLGEPTPERGGKSKRFYKITDEGIEALRKIREIETSMWDELTEQFL